MTNSYVKVIDLYGQEHWLYLSHDGFIDIVGAYAKHYYEFCEETNMCKDILGFATFLFEVGYSRAEGYEDSDVGPCIEIQDQELHESEEKGYPWIATIDFSNEFVEAYRFDEDENLVVLSQDQIPDLEDWAAGHPRGGMMTEWLEKRLSTKK